MRIAASFVKMIYRRIAASRRRYDWMRPPIRARGHI